MLIRTMHKTCCFAFLALLFCALLPCTASAATVEATCNSCYCFSAADFSDEEPSTLRGVIVTAVPSATDGTVCYGNRVIAAGDILNASILEELKFSTNRNENAETAMSFYPVYTNTIGEESTVCIKIKKDENMPPEAASSQLETYKNIANSGTLEISDPDDDTFTYTIVTQPKRGTVEIQDDGTFVYTPKKNKVGKDKFTFTATDSAGNTSNEATVSIEILKPLDAETYADMRGSATEFEALWLKNTGLYTGCQVGSTLCFVPDAPVSRGEFLVMTMQLLDIAAEEDATLCSGFSDEQDAAQWMRPYLVSAMRQGIVSGTQTEAGLCFRPNDPITAAEAAVMLNNALSLPSTQSASSLSDTETNVPAWAACSVSALAEAGISMPCDANETMTRNDTACLLYHISKLPLDEVSLTHLQMD